MILARISDPPPACAAVLESDLAGITGLTFSFGAITSLASGDFAGLSALMGLFLDRNALTTLPADVFAGLSALETLTLGSNRLTTLPADIFDGLTALESLDLRANRLTTLPAGVFDGLTALEGLFLNRNNFTTLPAGVFDDVLDTLGAIDVGFFVDDNIRSAHFVCSRPDAEAIVTATAGVNDCLRITSAQFNVALANAGLSALTISAGTLMPEFDSATFTYSATVPNAVATLTITPTAVDSGSTVTVNGAAMTTAALDVGANEIEVVVTAANSITPIYRLTVTRDVPRVNICDRTPQVEAAILAAINPTPACESVPETALAGITELDFDSASISSLANGDFAGLSGLVTLNLNFNSFTSLPVDVFDGLLALETLILTNSLLTTLPADVFDGLTALESLDLSENVLFTTLPADVFAGLSALVTLDLSGTTLTTLPAGVFDDLSALESLDFGQSRLTMLPDGVFDRLSALERLDFNQTRLTTLPDGVFDDLSALVLLNVSNTDLTTLPADVFDGLAALETLNLSNTDLTTLPAGVFNGLSALERLNLLNNNFTTLPDGVFDDVLDTLGTIDVAFNVDDTVRNAHFVCSRPDAATIVANTDGVTDCLRITTAQLFTALPNAGLSALTISQGTLTPVFDRTTLTYSATVPNTVAILTLTPTAADSGSTVAVTVNAGTAMTTTPFTAALNVGANDIAIVVTAADGTTTLTYRLTVTRANNPLDLNQDQTVNAQDAQILYYLSLTPRPDNLLNTLLGNAENIAALEAGADALAGENRFNLDGNDGLNQNDWRLLYYALRFEDELSASPALRNALGVTEATLDAVRLLIE